MSRRCIMASVMNMKETGVFCDEVFTQLSEIKKKIVELKRRSSAGGMLNDIDGGKFVRQLGELADQIDWRLQILSHSCSHDWAGSVDYEGAQVEAEKVKDVEFSPGYLGG
jgi:hypothetical protein